MYLVDVPTFLGLDGVRPHRRLLAEGRLVAYDPAVHRGRVGFVSHPWRGRHAPLRALQRALRDLLEGRCGAVEADWIARLATGGDTRVARAELVAALPRLWLWIDCLALPQPGAPAAGPSGASESDLAADLAKAVASLPSYVERTDLLLVLAPPAWHADAYSS